MMRRIRQIDVSSGPPVWGVIVAWRGDCVMPQWRLTGFGGVMRTFNPRGYATMARTKIMPQNAIDIETNRAGRLLGLTK